MAENGSTERAWEARPVDQDLAAVASWLTSTGTVDLAGDLTGRLLTGGKSNLTFEITDGASTWVLRRPPRGHVQATAHDMGREFTVMSALRDTDVPVPGTVAHCTDESVLGAPFYVMERVDGVPYRTADQLRPLGAERTRAITERMVDVLAALHHVDPASVGLAEFGRPDGFLERQVRRWTRQLEGSRNRDLPGADELAAALAEQVPTTDRAAIVHGDYRLDNLLVGPDDDVAAVVDWEMATLGDPLTDLALLLVYDRLARLDLGGQERAVSDASLAPGYPSADEVQQRYASAGHDLDDLRFHLGLGFFKLAVILEGIHYRHEQGQTTGDGFEGIGAATVPLMRAGLDALRGS
jgi:aminoglycoside phosphotransferase (APT) family kinase protein